MAIDKVAVIGAGLMGGGIAAHVANEMSSEKDPARCGVVEPADQVEKSCLSTPGRPNH